MAQILQCRVCGRSAVNTSVHQECHVAELSDLLHCVQTFLKKHPGVALPPRLRNKILRGSFTTVRQHLNGLELKSRLATQQRVNDDLRHQAMLKAAREFDTEHPDPDPDPVSYA